jgi:integral membrane protein (TIGR01906 family)
MLFFISIAVVFTVFFKPLYYFDIKYLHINNYVSMDIDTIKKNYDALIQYQSIFYHNELVLPDFVMSTTGKIHFEEVKRIFVILQLLCILLPIITIPMIYKNVKDKEYDFLKLTSIFSIGIPAIIALIASADFDRAFVLFHKIAFRNNYWIFDARTDPVINILPENFFMHCFIMIVCIVIILSIISYMIYRKKAKEILKGEIV